MTFKDYVLSLFPTAYSVCEVETGTWRILHIDDGWAVELCDPQPQENLAWREIAFSHHAVLAKYPMAHPMIDAMGRYVIVEDETKVHLGFGSNSLNGAWCNAARRIMEDVVQSENQPGKLKAELKAAKEECERLKAILEGTSERIKTYQSAVREVHPGAYAIIGMDDAFYIHAPQRFRDLTGSHPTLEEAWRAAATSLEKKKIPSPTEEYVAIVRKSKPKAYAARTITGRFYIANEYSVFCVSGEYDSLEDAWRDAAERVMMKADPDRLSREKDAC